MPIKNICDCDKSPQTWAFNTRDLESNAMQRSYPGRKFEDLLKLD